MPIKDQNFYLGNQNLPTSKSTFDYGAHPEWVVDIEKCRKNILHFAENFFYIINPDDGKIKIKLRLYQKRILRSLRDNRFVVTVAGRQCGKALDLLTPILTPLGWTTMGALKVGDYVYGIDGKPVQITHAHETRFDRNCYEVEFDNGEKIVADEEHLWFTQNRNERNHKKNGSVKNTKQIFDTLFRGSKKEPNHRIPTCINGISGTTKQLPIDPYILGLWLGDGAKDSSSITVGKRDITDITTILNEQTQFNFVNIHHYRKDIYTINLQDKDNRYGGLVTKLRENNLLGNKHIPNDYLLADRAQRLSLLQGLMDSDGYITPKGAASFYNTDLKLALQVKELIESLGYKATYKTFIPKLKGIECAECAIVNFTPIEYVCRISFKKDRIKLKDNIVNTKLRAQWHYIKNITKVESRPVRCITVDREDGMFLAGKQLIPTHNSTVLTIYALWCACFFEDQRILLVANKETTAIQIFRRVKVAYEMLPNWLKPGVTEYGKTSMALANGSSIAISTTSGDTARGESVNVLILDELAHVPEEIAEAFWQSVYPVISASKKSKIFAISTPNGTENLFYTIFDGAAKKTNGWFAERVDYWEIPGRDEEWKKRTIREIGSIEMFEQEYNNTFHRSGEAGIDDQLFERLQKACKPPLHILDDGDYLVWKMPDPNRLYTVGVDVGEGVGSAATVMQILDITDLKNVEQVATYCSNKITPIKFIPKLNEILNHWGKPPILIERNNCGAQVVDQLKDVYRYENIVNYGINTFNRIGIQAHTNTKYKGVMNMRYWVNESNVMQINDIHTVNELRSFQRQSNGTWCAKNGCEDDRVMSLIWSLMMLDNEICEKYFEIVTKDKNNKPAVLKLFDYGTSRTFQDITSNIKSEREENADILPVFINPGFGNNQDIEELQNMGWRLV